VFHSKSYTIEKLEGGKKMRISQTTSYQLIKSNDILQKVKFDLSEFEQRMMTYIIGKLDTTIQNSLEYEFNLQNIFKEFEIKGDNEENYKVIKSTLKKLRDKSLFIAMEDETEMTISWINKVTIDKKINVLKIQLNEDMKDYLITLKNNFSQDDLRIILKMKSQYSIRMYDLFNQYTTVRQKTFILDDIKKVLMVENIISYENFKEFRKYVLDQAIREINDFSDLIIEYETVSKGNKIIKLNFKIKKKKNLKKCIVDGKVY
jgi:plasmid replication initiation protein